MRKISATSSQCLFDSMTSKSAKTVPSSRHPGQNISQLIAKHGVRSSLLYGGIDTVNGVAIGAITYEFGGDNVESFLNELAQNSDIVDFGTAAQPTPYEQALIKAGQEQA